MAVDKLFFRKAANLNKNAVPEYALWAQCIMASVLCLSGKYGDLLDMIAFVVVLFYAATIIGIFRLRKTRPDAERPYKAFGYPSCPSSIFCCDSILRVPYSNETIVCRHWPWNCVAGCPDLLSCHWQSEKTA